MAIWLGTVIAITVVLPLALYYLVKSERAREQDRQQQRQRRVDESKAQRQRTEYIERNRRAGQLVNSTSRPTTTQAPQHHPPRDYGSLFPPPPPIPPVQLHLYLQTTIDQQAKEGVNSRLRRYWQILIDGLTAPRNPGTVVDSILLRIDNDCAGIPSLKDECYS
jgi:hypothetical protein